MATKSETPTPAATETPATAPEAVLAARYKRQMTRAVEREYRRVVREFGRDAGCTEEAAKLWLQNAGISEPPKNGNGA